MSDPYSSSLVPWWRRLLQRRRRPRVVLWGARRGDVLYGTFQWRLFVYERDLRMQMSSKLLIGFDVGRHSDHMHVAAMDIGGVYHVLVEPGTMEPKA